MRRKDFFIRDGARIDLRGARRGGWAVKDLAVARRFHEDTRGLVQHKTRGDELIVCRSGATRINVYRSHFAGTCQATAVTWSASWPC